MKLLRIDASARAADQKNPSYRSISRQMADHFISQLPQQAVHIIRRDVGKHPPSAISEFWIEACFTAAEQRSYSHQQALLESDTLIAELATSSVIVLATPMYNYGMLSALKAWVDQVIRINKTFDFDATRGDSPLRPLLQGKTLILCWSCGEYGLAPGEHKAAMNHLVPHLKTVAHYLGVERFIDVQIQGQEFADERHQQSREQAFSRLSELAQQLTAQ